jgi:hypothetical protein
VDVLAESIVKQGKRIVTFDFETVWDCHFDPVNRPVEPKVTLCGFQFRYNFGIGFEALGGFDDLVKDAILLILDYPPIVGSSANAEAMNFGSPTT